MDPPALMGDGAFGGANAAPYNLAEIWPFAIGSGGGDSGAGLGLRRPQFGQAGPGPGQGHFGDIISGSNRDVSGNDPMSVDQRGNHGGAAARKRREVDDDSAKGVSTSSGNGVVFPIFLRHTRVYIFIYIGLVLCSCIVFSETEI